MSKNLKILLALFYLACLGIILYGFFSFVDISQVTNYSYLRDNTQFLIDYKNQNFLFFLITFFLFSVIWVLLLGFGSPIALISGFIFGKIIGSIIIITSFSIGCTLLYALANFYFKELVINYLPSRVHKMREIFNKNEFFYFLLFRFFGGGGIPFGIQNILPVIFDMKIKNYFNSTLLGLLPSVFIINSLGEGMEKVIGKESVPTYYDIISDPNIYLPIIGFLALLIISYFIKKKYFYEK
tara:strand:+ start:807 stop:1526 length:720 start_codon:yes stop_codon:yes gene_type:complete